MQTNKKIMSAASPKLGIWARAAKVAEQTPADRNRYVDLLRALSISAVVLGHWIIAAPAFMGGIASMDHLLQIQPPAQWLTWLFQVMPLFFFVGGYSNGVSWDGAQAKGLRYSFWLESRLRRLLGPVIPLVLLWAVLGIVGYYLGLPEKMIRVGSQIALVPTWFLAIYFVIVMLVPVTRALWRKLGLLSVMLPFVLAVIGDIVFFNTDYQWYGWFNYFFIWGAVHQLGYAWQQGRLKGVGPALCLAIMSATLLLLLTQFGPYPISLIGVPGADFSNTTPPKLPLIALGLTQIGLLLALEGPARRWLSGAKAWTATVLVNGFIMPVFLWHSTVMILTIDVCFLLLPIVLSVQPGSGLWWAYRPLWIVTYLAIMMISLPLFMWLERKMGGGSSKHNTSVAVIVFGLTMCAGLAVMAGVGVAGNGAFGLNWLAILLPVFGVIGLSLIGKKSAS
ncbi:MAG: hypothetical protein ACI854_001622 [Arenicella sp.]|jgi:hypothetical protein